MKADLFDAAGLAAVMAPTLGVELRPDWTPGVIAYLELAARMAEAVARLPLDERDEPAAIFEVGR